MPNEEEQEGARDQARGQRQRLVPRQAARGPSADRDKEEPKWRELRGEHAQKMAGELCFMPPIGEWLDIVESIVASQGVLPYVVKRPERTKERDMVARVRNQQQIWRQSRHDGYKQPRRTLKPHPSLGPEQQGECTRGED